MTQKRLHYLDMAKGIGIILVVTGHSGMGSEGLLSWLSSFHMPLFFVISGMLLFHRKEESLPFMESIRKKAKSILIPYSFFSLIYLVIDLYYIAIKHQELSLPDAALQTISFYGISVLWFLPTLFAGEVLFLLIRKKSNNLVTFVLCGSLCLAGIFCANLYAACYHPASGLLFFVWLGYLIQTAIRAAIATAFLAVGYYTMLLLAKISAAVENSVKEPLIRLIDLVSASLFFAVNLWIVRINGGADLRSLTLHNPALYFAGSLTGSLAVVFLCKALPRLRLLSYLGANSLIIMVTHLDCRVMLISHKFAGLVSRYVDNRYLFLFNIAISLLLMELVIIYVVNRWFPFVLGRKRPSGTTGS